MDTQRSITDFDDLGFDINPHREALAKMSEYSFSIESAGAILKARDFIFVRNKSGKFQFELASLEQYEGRTDNVITEEIADELSLSDAENILRDLETYFKRHFPGRYLDTLDESDNTASYNLYSIYVTVFCPA